MADDISENGILREEEFRSYKERSVRSKFMNQIFLGIGGATVFGIVAASTHALISMLPAIGEMTLGIATVGPLLGIAAVAAVGIGCLYIGAKYVAQSIMLDQDFQAKKIAHATTCGMAATPIAPETGVAPVTSTAVQTEQDKAKWADKMPTKKDPSADWATQVQAKSADPEVAQRA